MVSSRLHRSTHAMCKIFDDGGDSKRFGRLEYPLDLCKKVVREGLYCAIKAVKPSVIVLYTQQCTVVVYIHVQIRTVLVYITLDRCEQFLTNQHVPKSASFFYTVVLHFLVCAYSMPMELGNS